MYKLIIGNVKISVLNDKIKHQEAIQAAKQAIHQAAAQGKLFSQIEIDVSDNGLIVQTTEKNICRSLRKTLHQSLMDGILLTIKEKMYPTSTFLPKDLWIDPETGQEWRGAIVESTKDKVIQELAAWVKKK